MDADAQTLRPMGLTFLSPSQYSSIPLASPPLAGPLPDAMDLSIKFPDPGDQGKMASCVGWATSYLKSYQERAERPDDSHISFSPLYIYNQINKGGNCQTGTFIIDALNLIAQYGAARTEHFPYLKNCKQLPSAWVRQQAFAYRIASWNRVNVQSILDVKSHIASGFPILIGMAVPRNFHSYSGGIYTTPAGPITGGHAILVVGYNDAKSAFKLLNSWGENWGEDGFAWINYTTFQTIVREGYATQDIITVPPVVIPEVVTPKPKPTPVVIKPNPKPIHKPKVKHVILTKPISFSSILPELHEQISQLNSSFYNLDFSKFGSPEELSSTWIFDWPEAELVGSYHVYQTKHQYRNPKIAGNWPVRVQWIVGKDGNFDALALLSWTNEAFLPGTCEDLQKGYYSFLKQAIGKDFVLKNMGTNNEGETTYAQTLSYEKLFYRIKYRVPDTYRSTICITDLMIRKGG